MRAAPGTVELGRRRAQTWLLNGGLPGPMVRVRRGSEVRIAVENHLPEGTTLHWHGIRLPNSMDGVPGVTQPAIAAGDRFVYEFRPADAGTFFYHSHAGLQLDTGIQGPLVVEDPSERAEYDEEAFLQLDDWLDGLDGLPNGPVKDTFLPPPMQVSTIDMVGDNAGRWAFHCHNEYHADTGMLRVVSVE